MATAVAQRRPGVPEFLEDFRSLSHPKLKVEVKRRLSGARSGKIVPRTNHVKGENRREPSLPDRGPQ